MVIILQHDQLDLWIRNLLTEVFARANLNVLSSNHRIIEIKQEDTSHDG